MLMWTILVLMILIGIADLYLITTKHKTISARYHKLFPQLVDSILMIVVLALIWIYLGVEVFTPIMVGTILGHLCWHETG